MFACLESLAHVGLARVSASEEEGVRQINTSRTHRHAPTVQQPCTHGSVYFVRRINDFSVLPQQNRTWMGIEYRPFRAQHDSVSTGRQYQRFASPVNPSPQLDQKRCQNRPETAVSEVVVFPKRGRHKAALSTPIQRCV